MELAGGKKDDRQGEEDNNRSDERREIGVDVLDSDLRENRSQGCKDRGEKGPELPGRDWSHDLDLILAQGVLPSQSLCINSVTIFTRACKNLS